MNGVIHIELAHGGLIDEDHYCLGRVTTGEVTFRHPRQIIDGAEHRSIVAAGELAVRHGREDRGDVMLAVFGSIQILVNGGPRRRAQ